MEAPSSIGIPFISIEVTSCPRVGGYRSPIGNGIGVFVCELFLYKYILKSSCISIIWCTSGSLTRTM